LKGANTNIVSIQNTTRQNDLEQRRNELTERIRRIEEQSESGDMNQTDLEAEMREMRVRMEVLTQEMNEMSRHIVPPSYTSSGEGVHSSQNS
jgi:chromosome segregation ATPase